ncbi:MAG TPA: isoprenylcysteine carboxylmethyltransferase family protein [Micromonosporaceae bacterium]|nr:isoprenylcysteine carboxylmethyltransferase family protein [Micromonosporaceae bacterium]
MREVFTVPLLVSLWCWIVLEIGLVVRDVVRRKAKLERDRGTRAIVALSLGGSIFVGTLFRQWLPALNAPAAQVFAWTGVVVIWLGLALRIWAVVTLGRSFSTFVQVDAGQAVVRRGPYRWVRHPSYTGLLLIAFGFGLGAANWLSLAVCAVLPALGLVPRIAVEEAELTRVLGDTYRSYQHTTFRLVPGVW